MHRNEPSILDSSTLADSQDQSRRGSRIAPDTFWLADKASSML